MKNLCLRETMQRVRYGDAKAFVTKDGSIIRELMHPAVHGNSNQSFAQATIARGQKTMLHRHHTSEEIYHITAGQGRMRLGEEVFDIGPGDTICIPPGMPHNVENTGDGELCILCACAPPYLDDDTEIVES